MKIGTAFPSKYIKADDLGGQQINMTIQSVTMEDVDGRGEIRPVISFVNSQQGFVLNKTNANTITQIMQTDDTDNWANKEITLYPTQTEFSGKMVPCIRVALPQAKPVPQPANGVQQPDVPLPQDDGLQGSSPAQLNDDVPFGPCM
jgi:hypothetical protein